MLSPNPVCGQAKARFKKPWQRHEQQEGVFHLTENMGYCLLATGHRFNTSQSKVALIELQVCETEVIGENKNGNKFYPHINLTILSPAEDKSFFFLSIKIHSIKSRMDKCIKSIRYGQ